MDTTIENQWRDGQWVPVVVRHDCRGDVLKPADDTQINFQHNAGENQNAETDQIKVVKV